MADASELIALLRRQLPFRVCAKRCSFSPHSGEKAYAGSSENFVLVINGVLSCERIRLKTQHSRLKTQGLGRRIRRFLRRPVRLDLLLLKSHGQAILEGTDGVSKEMQ